MHENSLQSSVSRDLAAECDSSLDLLMEAFAKAVDRHGGDIPRTVLDFKVAVLGIMATAFETEFGAVLAAIVKRQAAEAKLETTAQVMALVMDSDDPFFNCHCISFRAGLHALQGGISQTDIAKLCPKKNGKPRTRACVQKRVEEIGVLLNLEAPSRGMKSPAAHDPYVARTIDQHARRNQFLMS